MNDARRLLASRTTIIAVRAAPTGGLRYARISRHFGPTFDSVHSSFVKSIVLPNR